MGDTISSIVSMLLRDGINCHYPNVHCQTDSEAQFDVCPHNSDFVIYDKDRGVYTVISGTHLQNPNFNLVCWYQLVVNGQRELALDTSY
jgi:hypothetical protein